MEILEVGTHGIVHFLSPFTDRHGGGGGDGHGAVESADLTGVFHVIQALREVFFVYLEENLPCEKRI